MKFETWLNKADKQIDKRYKKDLKKSKGLVANNYFDRIHQLYIAYNTSELTKKLVWATWFLAIMTIILSALTLYFKYKGN